MDFAFSSDCLNWEMSLIDIDANDASAFKVKVDLAVKHPTGQFSFIADDVWLEADAWDGFEIGLRKICDLNSKPAEISDMSQYFTLSIVHQQNCLDVNLIVREPLLGGGLAKLRMSEKVDLDSGFIDSLRECFNNWPKHW